MSPPPATNKGGGDNVEDVPDATPAAADAEDSGSEDESDDEEADEEKGFVFRPV